MKLNNKTVDEIFDYVFYMGVGSNISGVSIEETKKLLMEDVKQDIKQVIMDIIGEDENLKSFEEYLNHSSNMGDFGEYNTVYKVPLLARNKYRAEMHKKVEELFIRSDRR